PPHLPSFPTRRSSDLYYCRFQFGQAHHRGSVASGIGFTKAARSKGKKSAASIAVRAWGQLDPSRLAPHAGESGSVDYAGFEGFRSEEHTSVLQSRGHL